jgi:LPS-assembly lipoprotein
MKRHLTSTLILLLTAALLSACGFHLRGSTLYDDLPFKSVYVILPDVSQFGVEFMRNLRTSSKTKVVTDRKEAEVVVEVMNEKKTKSILSLNVQGRVREYSLAYEVQFRVRDSKNADLLAPSKIVLNRTLIFNELHALARESEEELLYRDMQTDLVGQVLRRLAAVKIPATPPAKEQNATTP